MCIRMHVCMHVCMHWCVYACNRMHVCIYHLPHVWRAMPFGPGPIHSIYLVLSLMECCTHLQDRVWQPAVCSAALCLWRAIQAELPGQHPTHPTGIWPNDQVISSDTGWMCRCYPGGFAWIAIQRHTAAEHTTGCQTQSRRWVQQSIQGRPKEIECKGPGPNGRAPRT